MLKGSFMKKFLFVLTMSLNCYIINASLPRTDAAASFAQKFKNLAKKAPVFDSQASGDPDPEPFFHRTMYAAIERDTTPRVALTRREQEDKKAALARSLAHLKNYSNASVSVDRVPEKPVSSCSSSVSTRVERTSVHHVPTPVAPVRPEARVESYTKKFNEVAKVIPPYNANTSADPDPRPAFNRLMYDAIKKEEETSSKRRSTSQKENNDKKKSDSAQRSCRHAKDPEYYPDSTAHNSSTSRREDVYVHHYHHDDRQNRTIYEQNFHSYAPVYSTRAQSAASDATSGWNIYNFWTKLKEKVLPKPEKKDFLSLTQTLILAGVGAALVIYFVEKQWPSKTKRTKNTRRKYTRYAVR